MRSVCHRSTCTFMPRPDRRSTWVWVDDPAVLELIDTTHRRPAMAQLAALERLIPDLNIGISTMHGRCMFPNGGRHDGRMTRRGGAIGSNDTKRHSFNPPSDLPSMMTASPPLEGGSTMSIGSRPHSVPIGSGQALDWPHGSSVLSCSSLLSLGHHLDRLASLCVVGVGFGRVYTHRAPSSFAGRPWNGNEPRD